MNRFLGDLESFVPAGWPVTVVWPLWAALAVITLGIVVMLMLGRGDSKRLFVSLLLSVVAHGLFAVASQTIDISLAKEETVPRDEAFTIDEILVQTDIPEKQADSQETPAWERLPEQPLPEPKRTEREDPDFEPPEEPEPKTDSIDPLVVAVRDLPELDPEIVEVPDAPRRAEAEAQTAEPTKLVDNEQTAESRPETALTPATPRRRRRESAGLLNAEIERPSRQGADEEQTRDIRPSRDLELANAAPNPLADIRRGPDTPSARERDLPAPDSLPRDDPGTSVPSTTKKVGSGLRTARVFTRRNLGSRSKVTEEPARPGPRRTTGNSDPDSRRSIGLRDGVGEPGSSDVRPEIARSKIDPRRATKGVPAPYQLRSLGIRKEVALRNGGSDASERAVDLSLKWLAAHQNVEGFWDADGFTANCPAGDICHGRAGRALHQGNAADRPKSGVDADSGLTGLAVLAFLGRGHTQEEGMYADQIDRALRWLIRGQTANGLLAGKATRYARMYCHGMATIAIGEAYGMTRDESLRKPLEKAIGYVVANQTKDGGWRYAKHQQGDISMFGWQLMSLKSAETAGLKVPAATRSGAIRFLVDRSLGRKGGLAAYRSGERPSPAMTAESLFCKQMLRINADEAATAESIAYLMANLPKRSETNLYYWYYATLSLFQHGGEPWERWNARLRDTLVNAQRKTGHAAGSWVPVSPWSRYGGRIYSTVMNTLCLEVYYRYLPMYQTESVGRIEDELRR